VSVGIEQRKTARVRAQLPVFDRNRGEPAMTRDVSTSGLFICAQAPREVGAPFVLQISFPDVEIPLQVAAEVARVESGAG
jgi:hypothetical protein